MNPLIELLQKNARSSSADLAELLGTDAADVEARIAALEASGAIIGYTAVADPEHGEGGERVSAVIEVKVTPERGGGFDRLASRIAKFDQVESCVLMSGGYDLSVVVSGGSLHEVARFVSEKLSSLEGVISTATHFHLKTYKRDGFLAKTEPSATRLPVAP
jgi:DNA-binding Lrp family transcriptional regulator